MRATKIGYTFPVLATSRKHVYIEWREHTGLTGRQVDAVNGDYTREKKNFCYFARYNITLQFHFAADVGDRVARRLTIFECADVR